MVFSSAIFLFFFLPAVYLLYLVMPGGIRAKNGILLLASILFYAFGGLRYVLLVLGASLVNYLFGLWVSQENARVSKTGLVLSVVCNLCLLGGYKYLGFFLSTTNAIFQTTFPVPSIVLPVGISFFTFQAMSYVIDVYRDKSLVQRNYVKVLLYIMMFPQLIAGPIVRYEDVAMEINQRRLSPEESAEGICRFVIGLAKKLLFANTMGAVADAVFAAGDDSMSRMVAWLGAIAYCLQIYFDFSGYSDMAIGLGHLFGFHFKENFCYPYQAGSIREFWHRWHISLSVWFREYLYFPLGGSRCKKSRAIWNRYVVFFCTGLWHGASFNFIIWGLLHGTFLVMEALVAPLVRNIKFLYSGAGKILKAVVSHAYVILIVTVAFVFFRAESLQDAFRMLGFMLAGGGNTTQSAAFLAQVMSNWRIVMFFAGIAASLPIVPWLKSHVQIRKELVYIMVLVLYILCICNLSSATYNPFIYFRF